MTAGIVMVNPKYPHNVGAAVRAASCFGAASVWWTGERVTLEGGKGDRRLPREERMREYQEVDFRPVPFRHVFDELADAGLTPVAVEVMEGGWRLPTFEHPPDAAYVFGPEDGGLGSVEMRLCHRHVWIPSVHCLNVAAAMNVVLYDRAMKLGELGTAAPGLNDLDQLDDDVWLREQLGIR